MASKKPVVPELVEAARHTISPGCTVVFELINASGKVVGTLKMDVPKEAGKEGEVNFAALPCLNGARVGAMFVMDFGLQDAFRIAGRKSIPPTRVNFVVKRIYALEAPQPKVVVPVAKRKPTDGDKAVKVLLGARPGLEVGVPA